VRHLVGGAARKRQQQDAMRIGALHQQMRDTMRKRVGLARPRARDDQQWTCAEFDRFALRFVELVQI
jgi:hypothetical protein